MKVRKLTRDVRARGLVVRTNTITGVDLVQTVAFDVIDEVGRFLKTDLGFFCVICILPPGPTAVGSGGNFALF